MAFQRVSALEVDIEDYEERVTEAEQAERERAGQVEQLVGEIERLESNNSELASVSDHTSQRIIALEAELEEFEAEGLATEESVRVQKQEIEGLMAQISDLQGSESPLANYELPAVDSDSYGSDDDASGIPAGHDPEDYEVSDGPSWES
jgi:chromosome segregation ATPase